MAKRTSITFILKEIGLQRKREGVQIAPRYEYLNRALEILLENPKVSIEKIYPIIAKENDISEKQVKEEILLAIEKIFSRKQQKEKFVEVFQNKKITNVEKFLRKIIEVYQNINL